MGNLLGPSLGGVLFQFGGFATPVLLIASVVIVVSLVQIYATPDDAGATCSFVLSVLKCLQ